MSVRPLPHIASIPPYPPGRPIAAVAREFGLDPLSVIKLASNENPCGGSPLAVAALREAAADVNLYPDFDCFDLYGALSEKFALPASQLVLGAGSSELIQIAVRGFMDASHNAIIPRYSFMSYEACVRGVGATAKIVDVKEWQPDLDAMLAAIDENTRVVFLTSPNNPTGVLTPRADIVRFAAALPAHVLLVIDGAYDEYVEPEKVPSVAELLDANPNVLILRTFSKIYGLAGLRVGYGMGSESVVGVLRKMVLPFSVNAAAQAAAVAALADEDFVHESFVMNATERQRMEAAFDRLGLNYVPSSANFVLVKTGDGPGLAQTMMGRGVIVRPVVNYGLREWIRVTVGLPEQNDAFLKLLAATVGRPHAVSPALK